MSTPTSSALIEEPRYLEAQVPVLRLVLDISDSEVSQELKQYPEGPARDRYALCALRLGVLALRQASGELDAVAVREAGQSLIANLGEVLSKRGGEITTDLAGAPVSV